MWCAPMPSPMSASSPTGCRRVTDRALKNKGAKVLLAQVAIRVTTK